MSRALGWTRSRQTAYITRLLHDDAKGHKTQVRGHETTTDHGPMYPEERRAAWLLAAIFAPRMLGLFLILPVLSVHGTQYRGNTPVLIGLAVGIYGLTQAALQIPFGMLSEKFGRKPVITAGLLLFALGSLCAAHADSIWGVIAGRALQGAGAIASVVLALTADLTRETQRTKAMGIIGASIGGAFAVALVVGPILAGAFGMRGLFYVTGALAVLGVFVLNRYVPTPPPSSRSPTETLARGKTRAGLRSVLADGHLRRLDAGIAILHFILTATFVALPLALVEGLDLPLEQHWWVYLIVVSGAMVLMAPAVMYADRRNALRQVLLIAIAALALAQIALATGPQTLAFTLAIMFLFFTAFNVLEASLPSLASRIAPRDAKGTALGVYATSQHLGAFLGGLGGGVLYQHFGVAGVFTACGALALLWLVLLAPKTTQSSSGDAI